MLKKHFRTLLITAIVILSPILVGVTLWDQLPAELPIHWDTNWEVDGYCTKPMAVFGFPFLLLVLHFFTVCVTTADPKHKNHSHKMLSLVFWIIPVISLVASSVTYFAALGKSALAEVIVPVFLGALFLCIGNYLPKCKQNYTVGIKLPWTLNDEENWNKTHRLAGWVWVIGGIIIVLVGLLRHLWLILAVLIIITLIPTVYSYILHRKKIRKGRGDTNG